MKPNDETGSVAAEKAVGDLPGKPSQEAIDAVEKILQPKKKEPSQ